ncbi:L-2,4-diaminobutyric acid acetyltransferase [Gandjariella thermophila]|uniref:L-2,4-diaminobutyric acid acetyltransferase n=1 Tax=Gandjariella thermophila TaxID=1931992 RepID=A0A4D4J820_9PSEU|nr:L-2,4-diaminobutyric acid acetyltransferase [Gandjariella thermophila]
MSVEPPTLADGSALWRIARDSGALDLNSSYAYLLWARDFAGTSAVARHDGNVVGFVTGYVRPDAPDTVVVWQVAVDASHRGGGVAGRLVDHVLHRAVRTGVRYLETTITADNAASIRLFTALAERWGAELSRSVLFGAELFPDGHEAEYLYRIGPLVTPAPAAPPADRVGPHA